MKAILVLMLVFKFGQGITIGSNETVISEQNSTFWGIHYFKDSEILASSSKEVAFYKRTGNVYTKEVTLLKGQDENDLISVLVTGEYSALASRSKANCLTWIKWGKDKKVTNETHIGGCNEKGDEKDGDFKSARFNGPYGLAKSPTSPHTVLVTDELGDNIREVDLTRQNVQTLTANQNFIRATGIYAQAEANEVIISSCHKFTNCGKGIISKADATDYSNWKSLLPQDLRLGYITGVVTLKIGIYAAADSTNDVVWIINSTDTTANRVYKLCTKSGQCEFSAPSSLTLKDNVTLLVGCESSIQQVALNGLYERKEKKNLCYGSGKSGVETINYKGKSFQVWCDMDAEEGPWIVFLKRFDGSTDFNRDMADYEKGFGNVEGEYWLGLEYLHLLTSDNAELRIDIERFQVSWYKPASWKNYAKYDRFVVGDRTSQYKLLEIDGYEGDAGDMETTDPALSSGGPHKGMAFSTKDRDDDSRESGNCAEGANGGWWFNACHTVCLTCGPYSTAHSFRLKTSQMMYYPAVYPALYRVYNLKAASMKVKLPPEYEWV